MSEVAIYLRRSVVDEDRPGNVSYDEQLRRCRELARGHGCEEPDVLVDWGKSGGEGREGRRIAYQELRQRIEARSIRWVVSYDLSRLSRSTKETLALVDLARAHGAQVHVADLGILDPSDPVGKFTMTALSGANTLLRDMASKRAREQVADRKARGLPIGLPPFGELPGEDATAVLAAFDQAGSYHEAARVLNERGIPTRRGGQWSGRTVWRIVQRLRPSDATRQARVRSRGRHALTGLPMCHCGAAMRVISSKWSPQAVCPRGLVDRSHPRPIYVAEPKLLEWVREEVEHLRLPDAIETEVAADEARLAKLARRRVQVLDMYEDELIDKAERDRRLGKIDEERAHVAVRASVIGVPAVDWTWPPETLNSVLRAIFERIQLGKDLLPVSAVWRVPEWRADDQEQAR